MILLFLLSLRLEAWADSQPGSTIRSASANEVKKVDVWTGIDKLKHFSVSLILTTSSYYYMKKPFGYSNDTALTISIPFSFLVGLGKEFKDEKEVGNHFSMKDLTVDILGIASGWAIANNLR